FRSRNRRRPPRASAFLERPARLVLFRKIRFRECFSSRAPDLCSRISLAPAALPSPSFFSGPAIGQESTCHARYPCRNSAREPSAFGLFLLTDRDRNFYFQDGDAMEFAGRRARCDHRGAADRRTFLSWPASRDSSTRPATDSRGTFHLSV